MTAQTAKPYRAEQRNGYWIAVDSRTGEVASYPAGKRACIAEVSILNRAYAEIMAETARVSA